MAHVFMEVHNAVAWWGPGVIAACVILLPWIYFWPWRNRFDYEELFDLLRWLTFGAFFDFYAVWFTLPYPTLAALVLFFAVPFTAIGAFGWLFVVFNDLHDWYLEWNHDRRKAQGKFYWRNWRDVEEEQNAKIQEPWDADVHGGWKNPRSESSVRKSPLRVFRGGKKDPFKS